MKKGDFIVLVVILATVLAVVFYNQIGKEKDQERMIEVRINGVLVETLPVSKNLIKNYQSEFGKNTLTILDGVVSVSDADCNDLICVDTKAAQESGDAIVCIPNRFTVEIIGKGVQIDAIAQ